MSKCYQNNLKQCFQPFQHRGLKMVKQLQPSSAFSLHFGKRTCKIKVKTKKVLVYNRLSLLACNKINNLNLVSLNIFRERRWPEIIQNLHRTN